MNSHTPHDFTQLIDILDIRKCYMNSNNSYEFPHTSCEFTYIITIRKHNTHSNKPYEPTYVTWIHIHHMNSYESYKYTIAI